MIEKIEDGGNTPYCCGRPMQELSPASTDGAMEKHVPVFTINEMLCGGILIREVFVKVGKEPHPATLIHHIKWIELETSNGIFRKMLDSEEAPIAKFYIPSDIKVLSVYVYCNLHGLWVATNETPS